MALEYFVHEGFEFQTIEVNRSHFNGLTGAGTIKAVRLESVVTALGALVATNLADLQSWWTSSTTDLFLRLSRQMVVQNANLISGTVNDVGGGNASNLHQLSYQYILPVGLSNCKDTLPAQASDVGHARDMNAIRSLEVQHNNIRKHANQADAWRAWLDYQIEDEISDQRNRINQTYLINP